MKNARNFILLITSLTIFIYACVAGGLKPKDVCVDFADRDAGETDADYDEGSYAWRR